MKSTSTIFSTILMTAALGVATTTHALANDLFKSVAEEIPAPIENVFVPQGFDSNDPAEIVIAGTFPNSCYRMGRTFQEFNESDNKTYVTMTAYHVKSDFCLQISVPFSQTVQLGYLPAGKHSVEINKLFNSEIPIATAKDDNRDDHIYAMVYGLIQKGARTFEIQGRSPNVCYELSEVRVNVESKDVVTILPIMKKIDGCDEAANPKPIAWIKSFDVPNEVTGKTLIQVRSLGSASVIQVVDLR